MAQQPVISVRGEARLEAEPEIAAISVTVQARDRDRRTVLDRLASRNTQVLDLIKGYGEAVEKLESGLRARGFAAAVRNAARRVSPCRSTIRMRWRTPC